jgi:hypothetical protein
MSVMRLKPPLKSQLEQWYPILRAIATPISEYSPSVSAVTRAGLWLSWWPNTTTLYTNPRLLVVF